MARLHPTQGSQTGGDAVAPKRVNFSYDEDSQWSTISQYADLAGTEQVATATYNYDYDGNLTGLSYAQANSTGLPSYTWTYNAAGLVTQMTSPDGTVSDTYDADNQLTQASSSNPLLAESHTFDSNGNRTDSGDTTGTDNQVTSDGTFNYTYLCPCQLAGGDFSRFCERFSQGTGWCSLSQRSMAASQIGWRMAAAHRSSWFPADRQWKQRYTFFSKCAEKDRLCGLCRPCTGHGPRTCAARRCNGTNVSRSSTSAMPIRQRTARKSTPAMAVVSGIQRRGTRASLFIDSPPHRRARTS